MCLKSVLSEICVVASYHTSLLQNTDDVDELYDNFNCLITAAYCSAYPIVTIRRKKLYELKPYIDSDLKRLISQKKTNSIRNIGNIPSLMVQLTGNSETK